MALVFGDTDPDRRFRQLDNVAGTGWQFMEFMDAQRRRKADEREKERLADLRRFEMLAEESPRGAIDYGKKVVERLGPGPEADFIQEWMDALEEQVNRPPQRPLMEAVAKKEAERGGLQLAADLGAAVPSMAGGVMQGAGMVAGERAGRMDPLREGLESLPFSERAAAEAWAHKAGVELPQRPEAFDPYADLPANVKAVLATQEGAISGDAGQAARIAAGLEQTVSAARGHDLQEVAAEGREADLALRRSIYELSARKEERLAAAAAKEETGGLTPKEETAYWKEAAKSFQEYAALEASRLDKDANVRANFKVSDFQAQAASRAFRSLVDQGVMTREEAELAMQSVVEEYHALVGQKVPPMKAWKQVMEGLQ